jgi:hypothetical protein
MHLELLLFLSAYSGYRFKLEEELEELGVKVVLVQMVKVVP